MVSSISSFRPAANDFFVPTGWKPHFCRPRKESRLLTYAAGLSQARRMALISAGRVAATHAVCRDCHAPSGPLRRPEATGSMYHRAVRRSSNPKSAKVEKESTLSLAARQLSERDDLRHARRLDSRHGPTNIRQR